MQSCTHVETSTGTTTTNNSSNNDDDNNSNDNNNNNNNNTNNNGLYFTRDKDKDTYPMLQLFMNTVKHNKMNKLIIES